MKLVRRLMAAMALAPIARSPPRAADKLRFAVTDLNRLGAVQKEMGPFKSVCGKGGRVYRRGLRP